LAIYGIFDQNLKEKSLQRLFLYCIPVSSIFLLMKYFETLFQADNRIKLLAQSRLLPKIVFGIGVLVLFLFFDNVSMSNKLETVWILFFSTQAVVYIFIISKINLSFKNFKNRYSEIL